MVYHTIPFIGHSRKGRLQEQKQHQWLPRLEAGQWTDNRGLQRSFLGWGHCFVFWWDWWLYSCVCLSEFTEPCTQEGDFDYKSFFFFFAAGKNTTHWARYTENWHQNSAVSFPVATYKWLHWPLLLNFSRVFQVSKAAIQILSLGSVWLQMSHVSSFVKMMPLNAMPRVL